MLDYARIALTKHITRTNELLLKVLKTYDTNASSKIIGTFELGFPNDVIRLAGGFATGLMVKWEASVPFIPIDTTANVCTTTISEIDQDVSDLFSNNLINYIKEKLKISILNFNYDRGNHFIILARSRNTETYWIILHSDAYRRGYDAITPIEDNWYSDDVKVFRDQDRYLRYIVGRKAETYYKMTKMAEIGNEIKHQMTLDLITDSYRSSKTYHHHFMPDQKTIIIGCYFVEEGVVVPIMTNPGYLIYLYKILNNGTSKYRVGEKILVPHGWGRGCPNSIRILIDPQHNQIRLNNTVLDINAENTLNNIENISIRKYNINRNNDEYLNYLKNDINGTDDDVLEQIVSFSKDGLIRWRQ